MKGLEYGDESSAFASVFVADVDEVPEFSLDILDVAVLENITEGSVLLTVEAKDPEGKEIRSAAQNKPINQISSSPTVCVSCLSRLKAHRCPSAFFI